MKKRESSRKSETRKAPVRGGDRKAGFFATVKGLLSSSDDGPKATSLLEKHHREMEKLFADIEAAKGDEKKALLEELATRLLAHMVIEEQLFYPRAIGIDKSQVLEGYEEHVVIRFALERVMVTAPKVESFSAKVKTLKDFLVNHDDEEEEELFPKVKKAMDAKAQRELGNEMQVLFDETVAAGWKQTLGSEGPAVPKRVRKAPARKAPTSAGRRSVGKG